MFIILYFSFFFSQAQCMIQTCIRFTTNLCLTQKDIISTPSSKNISQATETVSSIFKLRCCFSQRFVKHTALLASFMIHFRWVVILDFQVRLFIPHKTRRRYGRILYFNLFLCVTADWTQRTRQNICVTTWESGRNLLLKLIWFIQHRSSLQTSYYRYHTVFSI